MTADTQLDQLRSLIAALERDNAFYAPRLRAAGVDASIESLDAFRERMPFTTKADLVDDQESNPPYGTNLTFAPNAYSRVHQTSSTSGRTPLRWLDTNETWSALLDGWDEVFDGADVTSDDRVFAAFSFGPFIGFWMAFDCAARRGCMAIPGGSMSSATRLKVMIANDVTVLCCTPTYAMRLGEVAAESGVDVASLPLRAIIVAGEPGASVPATRAAIEALWPTAHVYDHSGMTEVGPVTYQCGACDDAVHVIDRDLVVEIIDPETVAPLEGNGLGELVLTTLRRAGSPVLRYRTGDLVRPMAAGPCPCGRSTMRLAGGIIGRADDMVFVRGVNLYPSAVDQIVRSVPGVAEYKVEVDTSGALAELRVFVEPAASCGDPAALCESVARAFRDTYDLRIPVAAVPAGDLPRFELKSRRWIRC